MRDLLTALDKALPGRATKAINCISESTEKIALIEDDNTLKKCLFVKQPIDAAYEENRCFKVTNSSQKELILWAIDGVYVADGKPLSKKYTGKCDCAFGHENYIGFIEFKLNASPSVSPEFIQKNRLKAIGQIGQTIDFLKDSFGIPGHFRFMDYKVEAFVCTPPKYPNKNTAMSTLAIEFLETHGVQLFEKSSKEVS